MTIDHGTLLLYSICRESIYGPTSVQSYIEHFPVEFRQLGRLLCLLGLAEKRLEHLSAGFQQSVLR
jgi:hypothetical protein